MATIDIVRRHSMRLEDLRLEIDRLASSLAEQLDVAYGWRGDELSFHRAGASGTIRIDADKVRVNVGLAMLLRPLRGRVECAITEYLDAHVS